mmetsp:Transcript_37026/g.60918  ORF Transcript_37026/g.60918 Transcript_37026/m.60918 type:complete len:178 (+) Transcript_37026:94-627(+)
MSLHIFPDITPRTKEKLMEEKAMRRLHADPPLPDDVDEHGNLPELKCGWKKCGKEFKSRDALMAHVRKCIPHPFVGRFHINCKNVLENDPEITLDEFLQRVMDCYEAEDAEHIERKELVTYYNQFQPLFKNHHFHEKHSDHINESAKEMAEILFNFRIESQKHLAAQNMIPDQFIIS